MNITKIAVAGLSLAACTVLAAEKITLKDQKDKVGYSIGLNIGSNMKNQGLDVTLLSPEALAEGLRDALTDGPKQLTEEQITEVMKKFTDDMKAKAGAKGDKNKQEGEAFLAENKKKAGVKTLASGLQYKVIKEGTGKTPKSTDTVDAHYAGTLINGKEFDSSYKRGKPLTIPVTGVIKGWTEALQLMKEGSKWQLYIPSDLAYGEQGAGADIGPNSVLIFDIELLAVKAGPAEDAK
jgi:FKBP-type peptidyl-prolyl cis-trans isomerase FklB